MRIVGEDGFPRTLRAPEMTHAFDPGWISPPRAPETEN